VKRLAREIDALLWSAERPGRCAGIAVVLIAAAYFGHAVLAAVGVRSTRASTGVGGHVSGALGRDRERRRFADREPRHGLYA